MHLIKGMGSITMLKKILKTGIVASAVALGAAGSTNAKEWSSSTDRAPSASQFAKVYGETLPPIGWVQFCQRHKRDCSGATAGRTRVHLTDDAWTQLVRVNTHVNTKVAPVTDQELYNMPEHWTYPGNSGDCEDYVLLKRRYLMSMGWPREALLVTVVLDERNAGHAVLTVVTNMGDFVLDNQNPEILPWHSTRYMFVKRQAQKHPQLWVSLLPKARKRVRTIPGKAGD